MRLRSNQRLVQTPGSPHVFGTAGGPAEPGKPGRPGRLFATLLLRPIRWKPQRFADRNIRLLASRSKGLRNRIRGQGTGTGTDCLSKRCQSLQGPKGSRLYRLHQSMHLRPTSSRAQNNLQRPHHTAVGRTVKSEGVDTWIETIKRQREGLPYATNARGR